MPLLDPELAISVMAALVWAEAAPGHSLMVVRKRRSAPTYLVRRRGKWHCRSRYLDSLGHEHWPCEVSSYPLGYQRSQGWPSTWRLDWIWEHEAQVRELQGERQRPPARHPSEMSRTSSEGSYSCGLLQSIP